MTLILPLKLAHHLASAQVPDLDGAIVAPADKTPTTWIEGQCSHQVLMARQRADAFAGGRIPHLDLLVVGTRHDDIVLDKACFECGGEL